MSDSDGSKAAGPPGRGCHGVTVTVVGRRDVSRRLHAQGEAAARRAAGRAPAVGGQQPARRSGRVGGPASASVRPRAVTVIMLQLAY